jgi:hypothetical protein
MIKNYRLCGYSMFLILFAGCLPVSPQSGSLKGKIMDGSTGSEVGFGNVLNYSRHINSYSNSSGEFVLDAGKGDTLVFSALGYYYKKVIVSDSLLRSFLPVKFVMMPRTYEITEAHIFAMGSYDAFRRKILDHNEPRTKTQVLAEKLSDISRNAARDAFNTAQANRKLDGITLLTVPIRSPEEKERIALARILEQEKIRDQIYQKFNPEVIKKVTGLKEDDDIIEFIVFCDFSDQYLLQVNEYDLMTRIAMKYEAFKKKRKAMQSDQFPVNLNHELFNPNT